MRILHVNNQASVGFMLSRAQRELGHESDLLAVRKTTQRVPDHSAKDVKGVALKLLKMAPRYDLIHVHGGIGISGVSLMPFKAAGKRFFAHYHGSELRENIQTSFSFMVERIFVSTPDLLNYSENVGGRELLHIPNPVFIENVIPVDWNQRERELETGKELRLAHLPSRREIKGTHNVIAAVERARKEGADIDLDIIEKVEVDEAMMRLQRAHVCIDWMSSDYMIHGVVSVEAMVRGIPTICNIDAGMYPDDIPIISATPGDLAYKLVELNDDRSALPEIGKLSREYALKYHHPVSVAKRIEEYI
jgi:glycosyltransferase involved in cell wall biosynthesis